MFPVPGLIIGTEQANYFTPHAAAVDPRLCGPRAAGCAVPRSGALRFPKAPIRNRSSPISSPVQLPDRKGTFHRDFTSVELTPEGAQSILCRLDDDTARNWSAGRRFRSGDYQEVGEPKPGAGGAAAVGCRQAKPSSLSW
jgi:hypothetical protein